MNTEVRDIEMLERAILTEARDEADQIKAEAKEKADAIRKRAQEQAETERQAILDRAREEAARLRSQYIATAQMKARTMQLEHREKLLDRVFEAARQELSSLQQRTDYNKIVEQLLREVLVQLEARRVEVRADGATERFLKAGALEKLSVELNAEITFAKTLDQGTGIIVDAADGKLHYDNTFETRLSRLQTTLRSPVYQILTGEKQ